ncbi:sialin isoform X1 [Coccinella septempunctata]|uniref:sialin isoform X1 n=2 Tax=Coccinella septempunctata TaxID=41139 RepID=UPI001D060138|nr:sialin isoform X1 [Coccinella septempunctata]
MDRKEKILTEEDVVDCCPARRTLWFMVFFGFMINYNLRLNMNIAIVSMVENRPKSNISLTSECIVNEPVFNASNIHNNYSNSWNSTVNLYHNKSKIHDYSSHVTPKVPTLSPTYPWNEKEQGILLGAFFWLHWLTQVPGGILAAKYGTKLVFGLSNFIGVLLALLIPTAASFGYRYLLLLRVIQGICTGFAWPSMHNMTAKWIPPNQRSKFITAYLGSSVGAGLTYILCGFLMDTLGWEAVFYFTGTVGSIWYLAWLFLVYDSPAQHPRISEAERKFIEDSLGKTVTKNRAPIPWRSILTSVPVWMNCLGHVGGLWGLFMLLSNAPIYFRFIHGWKLTSTGILSGVPQFFRMLSSMVISRVGDYILKNQLMSRTNVRKLATAISTVGQGFCMIAIAYSGCNSMIAFIFVGASAACHGAVSTGVLASIVDNSPNYASIVLGIANSLVCFNGFATPALVGYFTNNNQTIYQWQKIYLISATILMVTGVLYTIFSSSKLMAWNDEHCNELKEAVELRYVEDSKTETCNDGEEEKMLKNNYREERKS